VSEGSGLNVVDRRQPGDHGADSIATSGEGLAPKRVSNMVGYLAALLGRTANGRATDWLDRSPDHRPLDQFTNIQMGLVMNTVLGIAGAAVASWLLSFLGVSLGGWIGYLIAGFIGACVLIAIARALTGGLQQPKKF
jgi:uncharacterized membrane protein YeaQ/YmgE (transglycosylase-associated protein family)